MQADPHDRWRLVGAGLAVTCVLALGCATPRPRVDPLASINRGSFALDAFTNRAVFGPVARGVDAATSEPVRVGIENVFHNLSMPKLLVATLLQGEPVQAGTELARFVLNTTFGGLGWFDVAAGAGLETADEDMGQVLCAWRVPVGPYVYFPVLGPSSAAEAVSSTLDLGLAPIDLLLPSLARRSGRTRLLAEIEAAAQERPAPYDYQRVAYQKNRLRHAWDEPGFEAPTSAELEAEVAYGTCGYQGAR